MNRHHLAVRLRTVIRKHGSAGMLAVGLFLLAFHCAAWIRKRWPVLPVVALAACFLFGKTARLPVHCPTTVQSHSEVLGPSDHFLSPPAGVAPPMSAQLRSLIAALGTPHGRDASIRLASLGKTAVPALVWATKSASWRRRYWAVAALGMFSSEDGDTAGSAIAASLKDEDARVRISAVLACSQSCGSDHDFAYFNRHNVETNSAARTIVDAIEDKRALPAARSIVERLDGSIVRALSLPKHVRTDTSLLRLNGTRLVMLSTDKWDIDDIDNHVLSVHLFDIGSDNIEEQDLEVPEHWRYRDFKLYRIHGRLVLIMTVDDPNTGTEGVSMPLFFKRSGKKWVPAQTDPRAFKVSQFGTSWFDTLGQLRLCDYLPVYDTTRFPARFSLRTFVWRKGRMTLVRTQRTRKIYGKSGTMAEAELPPNDDPMHEFGLKWPYK